MSRIEDLKKELSEDPSSRAFVPLVQALVREGQGSEAVSVARQGLRRHPHYLGAKLALAHALLSSGEHDEAMTMLNAIVAIMPDHVPALQLLVEAKQASGAEQEARILQTRLDGLISPSSAAPTSHEPEASNEFAKGQVPEKQEVASVADEGEQTEAEPLILSEGFHDSEDEGEPSSNAPESASVTLAKLYLDQKHHAKAREILKTVLSTDPQHPEAKALMASLPEAFRQDLSRLSQEVSSGRVSVLKNLLDQIKQRRRTIGL